MEEDYGFGAIHPDNTPEDWVKPGSNIVELGYRRTDDRMKTSKQVPRQEELQTPKFLQERDLFQRKVRILNHCCVHKCSAYCAKDKSGQGRWIPN